MRTNWWVSHGRFAVALAALCVLGSVVSTATDNEKGPIVLTGTVTMSTSANGEWTFVTIPASERSKPLVAAYVIQHMKPLSSPISFAGEGTLRFGSSFLTVQATAGPAWSFQTNRNTGSLRKQGSAHEVAGIATYGEWSPSAGERFPASHEEFVKLLARTTTGVRLRLRGRRIKQLFVGMVRTETRIVLRYMYFRLLRLL